MHLLDLTTTARGVPMLKQLLCSGALSLAMASNATMGESRAPPPQFNPPKQYYLALGDSLAFGFRFDVFNQNFPVERPDLFHGYVDDFGAMLRHMQPNIQTTNFGCVGETTDTFID